jgi:hypothetical protein
MSELKYDCFGSRGDELSLQLLDGAAIVSLRADDRGLDEEGAAVAPTGLRVQGGYGIGAGIGFGVTVIQHIKIKY